MFRSDMELQIINVPLHPPQQRLCRRTIPISLSNQHHYIFHPLFVRMFRFIRSLSVRNTAEAGRGDQFFILIEYTAPETVVFRSPSASAALQFGRVHVQRDPVIFDIQRDPVAIAHQGQRAALERLRADVPDHEAVGAAREPAIGDEGQPVAEPLPP